MERRGAGAAGFVRSRLLGAQRLEPLHHLGALGVELVEPLQEPVADGLQVRGRQERGARGLSGLGRLRGRGKPHQRRLELRDLPAQVATQRGLACRRSRGHEGSPAMLAARDALGLEARVDSTRGVHVHARRLGKLADARKPVARTEPAALDGRADTAGELGAERDVGIPVNA